MIAIFPEIASAAGDKQIETASYLVRKYFGLKQAFSPTLDVTGLCRAIGIPVDTSSFSDFGALAVKDEKGRFSAKIVIKSLANPLEQNFLIAHLLGHFFLHVQPYLVRGEWQNTGFKEIYNPALRFQQSNYDGILEPMRSMEIEADHFASAMLLPKAMLKKALQKLKTIDAMAQFFNMNGALIERRLESSGLVSETAPRDFRNAERSIRDQQSSKSMNSLEIAAPDPVNASQKSPQSRSSEGNSAERVSRTMAVHGYKRGGKKEGKSPKAISQGEGDASPIEESLKMFRKLAHRLDSTVKSDD
ncbi:ImmA/IrrE family metallo-endopeptidase [Pseudobacteriovorax antillogorgiicola]|uniref:IrrE N-terminal-like domain-containing protein n=1 Tax=Pseudobacteriovorax antillogorgiicola TaxID=1513793 RepID=A0A1Y6BNP7_9BACT|nr:ImmA/IrrE family metallo-endopeptidase [Pseudobacteriovorax antillogorgiicola]TCS53859.1 uncharacterized protein DUF955 [Pseudobacteriovorax antillogorgiicola]SMF21451.1 protein of unknown function [Pseudobacteriovorax antillogorgiicola]